MLLSETNLKLDIWRLDELVEEGYISRREHPDNPDLVVYNYTAKAQYERRWTPETLACRGLILRGEEVVARPFPKFFNLSELIQAGTAPSGPFVAQEKMDGSLGIIYIAPDGLPAVATRGSFASDQANWATAWLRSRPKFVMDANWAALAEYTLLVEIIYPENRIVIDYGRRNELVLLTAISHKTGLDITPSDVDWSGSIAEVHPDFDLTLFNKEDSEGVSGGGFNREGIVLRWKDGSRAKVKFEEYVRLHKIVTRVTERTIWEMLVESRPIESLAEYVPDEFYEWMKSVANRLALEFTAVEKACFAVLNEVDRALPRKDQAEFVLSRPNSGIVFKMLDGKPYSEIIWTQIRPSADSAVGEVE